MNRALRQGFSQFIDASATYVRAIKGYSLEAGHPFEVLQAGVGDPRVPKAQASQLGQPFQVVQASVGDPSAIELQLLEPYQPFEASHCARIWSSVFYSEQSHKGDRAQQFGRLC